MMASQYHYPGRHRHGHPMHGPPHFRKHLMLKLKQNNRGKEGGNNDGADRRRCGIDNNAVGPRYRERPGVKNFQPVQVHQEETNETMNIALDLPGFNASNLKVILKGRVLVLRGRRQNKLGDIFVVRQRFRLNQSLLDLEDIQANFDQGVLELTIPKRTTAPIVRNVLISTTKKPAQESSSKEEVEHQTGGVQKENTAVVDEVENVEMLEEDNGILVGPFGAMLVAESEQVPESVAMMVETVLEDGDDGPGVCTLPETDGYNYNYNYNTEEDSSWEDVDCV